MKSFLIASLIALLTPIVSAQAVTLLASTLPTCAAQCAVLTNAQGSCTPPLAPVTSDTIYESCFCQSALLTSLYSSAAVQGVCPSCSAADMLTIQKWYQGVCPDAGKGAPNFGVLAGGTATSSTASTTGTTTPTATTAPSASATSTSQQDSNSSTNPVPGPWMSTHWRWVVMLIVLIIGLTAVAVGGWFFHRQYHRKREAQWALGSRVDMTTWGPGQSVHDLGYYGSGASAGAVAAAEKGKAKEQVRGVNQPPPARMRENRLSKY